MKIDMIYHWSYTVWSLVEEGGGGGRGACVQHLAFVILETHSQGFPACLGCLDLAAASRLQVELTLPLNQTEPAQVKTFS